MPWSGGLFIMGWFRGRRAEVLEKKNMKAAVCLDCHSTHALGNTSSAPTKGSITANCGGCPQASLPQELGQDVQQIR